MKFVRVLLIASALFVLSAVIVPEASAGWWTNGPVRRVVSAPYRAAAANRVDGKGLYRAGSFWERGPVRRLVSAPYRGKASAGACR